MMRRFSAFLTLAFALSVGLLACDSGAPSAPSEPTGSDLEAVVESVDNDSTITVSEASPFELDINADRIGPGGLESPAIDTVYFIEGTTVVDSAQMRGAITVDRPFESTPSTGQRIEIGK